MRMFVEGEEILHTHPIGERQHIRISYGQTNVQFKFHKPTRIDPVKTKKYEKLHSYKKVKYANTS